MVAQVPQGSEGDPEILARMQLNSPCLTMHPDLALLEDHRLQWLVGITPDGKLCPQGFRSLFAHPDYKGMLCIRTYVKKSFSRQFHHPLVTGKR